MSAALRLVNICDRTGIYAIKELFEDDNLKNKCKI